MIALIIVAARDNLLARWSQHDAVLELCSVAALNVAKRRIPAEKRKSPQSRPGGHEMT
jgi:hypothetical protein